MKYIVAISLMLKCFSGVILLMLSALPTQNVKEQEIRSNIASIVIKSLIPIVVTWAAIGITLSSDYIGNDKKIAFIVIMFCTSNAFAILLHYFFPEKKLGRSISSFTPYEVFKWRMIFGCVFIMSFGADVAKEVTTLAK